MVSPRRSLRVVTASIWPFQMSAVPFMKEQKLRGSQQL
ncbi:MAG: hypothetical protein ACI8WY_002848, partial [Planctomycetota bacterium]